MGYNVVALDMASNENPVNKIQNKKKFHKKKKKKGGSYQTGSTSQEEDIVRRSDLVNHLHKEYYPIQDGTGIYIPAIAVFKNNQETNYTLMEEPKVISIVKNFNYFYSFYFF